MKYNTLFTLFNDKKVNWQDIVTMSPSNIDDVVDDDFYDVFVNGKYVFTILAESKDFDTIVPYLSDFDWQTPFKEFMKRQ